MAHDHKTAEALEESIRHWQANVDAKNPMQAQTSADDCALCDEFQSVGLEEKKWCTQCPVFKRTGQKWCAGTPFHEAHHALTDWRLGIGSRKRWATAAERELDFLISLRDSETSL